MCCVAMCWHCHYDYTYGCEMCLAYLHFLSRFFYQCVDLLGDGDDYDYVSWNRRNWQLTIIMLKNLWYKWNCSLFTEWTILHWHLLCIFSCVLVLGMMLSMFNCNRWLHNVCLELPSFLNFQWKYWAWWMYCSLCCTLKAWAVVRAGLVCLVCNPQT